MRDVQLIHLAGTQFNRVSRAQLHELGFDRYAIERRLGQGRLIIVGQGVLTIPPVLRHDPWGDWSGATLTAPGSVLTHASAGAAWGYWPAPRGFEIVTRPGNGGPRRHGAVLVFRSDQLAGDVASLRGIPVTTAERTLLDLAAHASERALARGVREAVRLELTTVAQITELLGRHRGRRGAARLATVLSRYSGLPLRRARSGAEVRALELLRDAGLPMPALNAQIAGEEADLSWPHARLIVEVDGAPFHLDAGEDARKRRRWETAGWAVHRVPSDAVYDDPGRLLAFVATNVPPAGA